LARRVVVLRRLAGERLLLAGFLLEIFLAGRAGRVEAVFFFELRVRVLADFFFDAAFEADFFLVTFLRESFRLAFDRLPALADFFLLAFFVGAFLAPFFLEAVFFVTFFFETFVLLAFFFVVRLLPAFFFDEVFFLETAFFRLSFFLLPFLAARTAPLLRDDFFATFFETFFLEAAFFLDGMRRTPGGFKRSRRLYIEDLAAVARLSAFARLANQGSSTGAGARQAGSRYSATTVV
jgi:hypothetical protein